MTRDFPVTDDEFVGESDGGSKEVPLFGWDGGGNVGPLVALPAEQCSECGRGLADVFRLQHVSG